MKKLLLTVFIITLTLSLNALGTLRVESIRELPATYTSLKERDADGKWAPVLIIKTELKGLGFVNVSRPTLHSAVYDEGKHEYTFYINDSQRVIEITHADYEPLEVRLLTDFSINVKTQRVYELVLTNEPEKEYISVNIKVRPEKAIVKIDGDVIDCGRANSITTGNHQIEIELAGYQTIWEEINVTNEKTLFEYQLKELENVTIEINSEPEDALVSIDDTRLGETPVAKNFLQGIYSIRIEKKDYETIYDTINIQPPKFTKLYNLTPNIGSFIVNSNPKKDLDIYINGENTFNRTPYTFTKQEPGEYKISAKSGMCETEEKIILLTKGEQRIVSLFPNPIFATLTIHTDNDAEIKINDEIQKQLLNIQLEPAVYKITASLPKADTVEKTLLLKKNQVETLDLFPQVNTGSIHIAVSPFDAQVELTGDAGEYFTANGSKKFEEIPIGKYQIDISRSDFMPDQRTVILKKNDTFQEEFKLLSYDKTMLSRAHKYKVHRNYSLIASGAFIAFGLLSNVVADGYYDDYQKAETNASAVSNRDNLEKWDNYRDYSYYISVGSILYSAYSWIKQIHYTKLARTKR